MTGAADGLCPTVVRAFAALQLFGASRPSVSQVEVADLLHISRAAARRLLRTLAHLGLLVEQPDGQRAWRYRPTPRVLEVGGAYLRTARTWELARPYLAELAGRTGYGCALGVLDGTDLVCVAHAPAAGLVQVHLHPGARLGLEVTALGWALLEGLPQAARAAWAADPQRAQQSGGLHRRMAAARRGWVAEGIWSLAVPVGGPGGGLGALGLVGPAAQRPAAHAIARLRGELTDVAAQVAAALPAASHDPAAVGMPTGAALAQLPSAPRQLPGAPGRPLAAAHATGSLG